MISSNRNRTLATQAGHWICASCRKSRLSAQRSLSSVNLKHQTGPNARHPGLKPTTRKNGTLGASRKVDTGRTRSNIPDYPARTRFAPSPTGYMHIGGLRTALFSYLLAKKTGGQFILRIEDTDQKRFVSDAEQRLCEDLQWAGLQWDEGPQVGGDYGPYKQSERNHIYQQYSKQLIDASAAYRCFCTQTAVSVDKSSYSAGGCYQSCSSLPAAQSEERAVDGKIPFTVRLLPVSDNALGYPDLVHGRVRRLKRSPSGARAEAGEDGGMDISDPVLVKGDGTPTYHFANVVDDHLMKITHVIRGSEWLASLPLHYDLYNAFNWQPPLFAHVGLLVNKDGSKLSKRYSDSTFTLDIPTLRGEQSILPETLRNYLALLGWSNPRRNDFMDLSSLIQNFDMKFTKGNAIVDPAKLWYLQKGHVHHRCKLVQETNSLEPIQSLIQAIENEVLALYSASDLHTRGLTLQEYITEILLVDCKDFTTPRQFVAKNSHFFHFDPALVPETKTTSLPLLVDVSPSQILRDIFLAIEFRERQSNLTTTFEPDYGPDNIIDKLDLACRNIHAAVSHSIWRAILRQKNVPWSSSDSLDLRSADNAKEHMTIFAKYISSICASNGEKVEEEELVKGYKASWNAMMKVLREKLCYGNSGAGMGHVLAIVGWEECCRRLEIDTSEAKVKGCQYV